ncbi:MAG: tetratricopeptide repeat protein [Xenococcaceae cyanobacterium MO_188.B29]|nr:tetratricopeptide repeat protein [Xenococcaceae cyanobacterium MO_188.B29]
MKSKQHLREAKEAKELGDISAAIEQYQTAIDLKSNQPIWVYLTLARLLLQKNNFKLAEHYFNLAFQLYPNNIKSLLGLANLAFRQQQWNLALARWNTVLEKFPESFLALNGRANTLIKLRYFVEAEVCFNKLHNEHSVQPNGLIGLAKLAMTQNKWFLALERWNNTLSQFPNNLHALKGRAIVFCELRCYVEAESDYDILYTEYPDHPEGLLGLIDVAMYQGHWNIALERAQRADEQFPDNIYTLNKKGKILIFLRQFKQAESIYRQIKNKFPEQPIGIQGLFEIAYQQENFDLAETVAISLSEQFSQLLSPIFKLINVYFMIGDVKKLELTFGKLLDNPELFEQISVYKETIRSIISIQKKEIKIAINHFKKATDNHEHNALLSLVGLKIIICAIEQNKLELLEDVLQIIYSNKRKPPISFRIELTSIIYQLLGCHYQNSKQYYLASLNYRKSIECNPKNHNSLQLLKELISVQYPLRKSKLLSKEVDGKIAIMIITCQKNKQIVPFLKKYLYQQLSIPYFFVIGNQSLSSDWFYESDILYVKTPDTYDALTEKVTKALECVYGLFNFKGILKLDDDIWIKNTDKFLNFIHWLEHECREDYLGRVVGTEGFMSTWMGRCYHWGRGEQNIINNEPYKQPNLAKYCGGGEGYYLSQRSINTIVEYRLKCPDTIHNEFIEDKYIGETLYLHGINPLEYSLSQFGLISDVDIEALHLKYLQAEDSNLEIDPNFIYKVIKT